MVSTRRTVRSESFNQRGSFSEPNSARPLKRVQEPSSIGQIFLIVALNMCKKIVFCNTYLRVAVYAVCLFAISAMVELVKVPRFYTNSFLNQYFVKLGWFWTLLLTIPFVFMTSYTYCCGKKELLIQHLARLGIATGFWFFWVNFFVYFEGITGQCVDKRELIDKIACLDAGGHWYAFDLSGHAFILIYSNLVLIEEARPIRGWEGIRDLIRDENHTRDNNLHEFGPLRGLNASDFKQVQKLYSKFLPYIRLNFFLITCLSVTWDYMLLSTILFFHSMPEKLFSGFIAIGTWYVTYELWYKIKNMYPSAPGDGSFSYFTPESSVKKNTLSRKSSIS